jgi:hypothetical protein
MMMMMMMMMAASYRLNHEKGKKSTHMDSNGLVLIGQ